MQSEWILMGINRIVINNNKFSLCMQFKVNKYALHIKTIKIINVITKREHIIYNLFSYSILLFHFNHKFQTQPPLIGANNSVVFRQTDFCD